MFTFFMVGGSKCPKCGQNAVVTGGRFACCGVPFSEQPAASDEVRSAVEQLRHETRLVRLRLEILQRKLSELEMRLAAVVGSSRSSEEPAEAANLHELRWFRATFAKMASIVPRKATKLARS